MQAHILTSTSKNRSILLDVQAEAKKKSVAIHVSHGLGNRGKKAPRSSSVNELETNYINVDIGEQNLAFYYTENKKCEYSE
ncbi:unnamed protein product [Onchocerca flexuosa]|uniref:Uncharacterized protein n=1 Tax=Onchocerca flexuosa TaxID=387005 RepID=A0A183HGY9_9BILA|nr:unnamed protein product [Onchocerca flexuosa]